MSRITTRFAELKAAGETALIPFITAGDPKPEATVRLMHTLVSAGADVIELGIPFSDPMADGPVIQRANERALRRHTSLQDVLAMVAEFRNTDMTTPVVLMGYLNPIETMGNDAFARAAARAGVDGTIIVDMPPEEGGHLLEALRTNGIDPIFLLAPTTTAERTQRICDAASGFLYYVSLRGVTGASRLDISEVQNRLGAIKAYTELPVGVGFGINSPETAGRVAQFADAVIVGSAIVGLIEQNQDAELKRLAAAVFDFVHSLSMSVTREKTQIVSTTA
ncbi:MAG: tryptophan synthase subunit alpha [Gammaproteobacteria bacterium]|nr:tryptophan synthase subunit alpha [Gammaproteobacteria bacterium]